MMVVESAKESTDKRGLGFRLWLTLTVPSLDPKAGSGALLEYLVSLNFLNGHET